jgi:hypothetical protein
MIIEFHISPHCYLYADARNMLPPTQSKTFLSLTVRGKNHFKFNVNDCPTRCDYVQFIIFL